MSDTYAAARATADRLERAAQNEELASLIAEKMFAAQQNAAAAAARAAVNPGPIRRSDFDRLSPQQRMDMMRAKRSIVD